LQVDNEYLAATAKRFGPIQKNSRMNCLGGERNGKESIEGHLQVESM
jgi:hypothetical protein